MTITADSRLAGGRAVLEQTRVVLERELPDRAAVLLREIGFSAGLPVYDGLVRSVVARYGVETPQALDARYLGEALAGFLRDDGWGTVSVESLAEGLLAVDSTDWSEAEPRGADFPSCHFTSGMLSDLFTRLGGYPAAVMEVECRSRGDARCRFLVGSPGVLTWLYDGMVRGASYDQLATELAAPRS